MHLMRVQEALQNARKKFKMAQYIWYIFDQYFQNLTKKEHIQLQKLCNSYCGNYGGQGRGRERGNIYEISPIKCKSIEHLRQTKHKQYFVHKNLLQKTKLVGKVLATGAFLGE
eukprot:TRINITY_DN8216_c0_g2_i1.p5 TRINITY_DN8216_c0_g2~~TRINITY_DN8216_c0_g2_i1.p5  ORF type:complete len:113 (+),score=11.68 TRINITY_DN8216_c0_g2_i1:72-410(+)